MDNAVEHVSRETFGAKQSDTIRGLTVQQLFSLDLENYHYKKDGPVAGFYSSEDFEKKQPFSMDNVSGCIFRRKGTYWVKT